ncbi:MAG: sulfotransferase [Phycisphaerales bacterium]|nr:sulfotransferase [Phycisphaerales bacterium]
MADASLPSPTESLADKARAVIPQSVREALRPLASKVGLARSHAESAAAFPSDADSDVLLELSRPSINAHTVDIRGRVLKYFFLTGCWRSGTHWVARVLNLHPALGIVGEFHFDHLIDAYKRYTATDGGVGGWYLGHRPNQLRIANEAMQTTIRRAVYAAAGRKLTASWIGDHSPRRLQEALPGARNIVVVRDGRDVLVSQAFHSLRAKRIDWFRPRFRPFAGRYIAEFQANPDSFKDARRGFLTEESWVRTLAREWAGRVRSDLDTRRRLEAEGAATMVVGYEDLHRNFEERRVELYRFFGLDPEQAEAPTHENKALPGFKQETVTSDNRKGIVGDWMNYFDEKTRRIYREEAGDALIELGYEKDLNW